MTINKKTRAFAACLLILLLLPMLSACEIDFPSELTSMIPSKKNGLYVNGNWQEMSVPERGEYFYDQLTDVQKTIYSASVRTLESGANAFELVGVNCNEYAEGCKRAIEALLRDHPEFFWIDGGHQIKSTTVGGNAEGTVEIVLNTHAYWDGRDLSAARHELEEAVLELLEQANACADDYEKVKFLNDWLAENVEYDYESFGLSQGRGEAADAFVNTVYGTLVEKKTLCGGYSYTVCYILDRLGIEALYVTGTTLDGLHAWNEVKLGEEYYHIDTTWADDNQNGRILYTYFCLDDAEMSLTHKTDSEFVYPPANGVEYNYYNREGLYLDSYSFNSFNVLFAKHGLEGGFSVKFPSDVVLRAAVRDIVDNARFYKLDRMSASSSFSYVVDEEHCILTLYP